MVSAEGRRPKAKVDEKRIDRLKLQVKRSAYLLYGRSSEKLTPEETAQLVLFRTEQSQPWLAKLELWVDTNLPKLVPTSRLAEACS